MKRVFLLASLLLSFGIIQLSAQSSNNDWPSKKANKWFKKKEWLNGAPYTPHASIDKVELQSNII